MKRWFKRSDAGEKSHDATGYSGIATETDVYYCYRLLLNRAPDQDGLIFYTDLIRNTGLPVAKLVSSFLDSEEFRSRAAALNHEVLIALDGFTLFVRANDLQVGAGIAQDHTYETHVTAELTTLLRPGSVFVDVGANIGYFTLLAASLVGSAGRILAFEPNLDNCGLLERSIAVNQFGNISLFRVAVGDVVREFAIDVTGSNGALREERRAGDVLVQTVRLDDCLAGEPRVDVLKMDVEGFEGRVLRGMKQLIARHRPVLITEFAPSELERRSHVSAQQYLDELRDVGYALFVLPRSGPRSVQPQDHDDIMAQYRQAHASHLDLVCYPH